MPSSYVGPAGNKVLAAMQQQCLLAGSGASKAAHPQELHLHLSLHAVHSDLLRPPRIVPPAVQGFPEGREQLVLPAGPGRAGQGGGRADRRPLAHFCCELLLLLRAERGRPAGLPLIASTHQSTNRGLVDCDSNQQKRGSPIPSADMPEPEHGQRGRISPAGLPLNAQVQVAQRRVQPAHKRPWSKRKRRQSIYWMSMQAPAEGSAEYRSLSAAPRQQQQQQQQLQCARATAGSTGRTHHRAPGPGPHKSGCRTAPDPSAAPWPAGRQAGRQGQEDALQQHQ
jgi:hypothetical protein